MKVLFEHAFYVIDRLFSTNFDSANGDVAAAAGDDDIWDDVSDSEGHGSILNREWSHRQNQFLKVDNGLNL